MCNPQVARFVHAHPVGNALLEARSSDVAPVRNPAVGGDVVSDQAFGGGVDVIEGAAVGGEADPIADFDPAVEFLGLAVEPDPVALAGNLLGSQIVEVAANGSH